MDENAELYATIMATQKPNPRGPGYIKLYLLVSVMLLCSTMNGFDSSLMGSINTLPNYTEYFGLPATGNASTGIVFAIFQVRMLTQRLILTANSLRGRSNGWSTLYLDGGLVRSNLAHIFRVPWCMPRNHHDRTVGKPTDADCWPILLVLLRDLCTHSSSAIPS